MQAEFRKLLKYTRCALETISNESGWTINIRGDQTSGISQILIYKSIAPMQKINWAYNIPMNVLRDSSLMSVYIKDISNKVVKEWRQGIILNRKKQTIREALEDIEKDFI